jgi:hypothetical protein
MNVSAAGQKRLVIIGATGMVGGYALRYALDHPAVERVTAIGRKKLGISHSKLNEVLHQDFADCSALTEAVSGQDVAVFCLGTYTGSVSDAELRKVTVDYTVEFAPAVPGRPPYEHNVVKKWTAQIAASDGLIEERHGKVAEVEKGGLQSLPACAVAEESTAPAVRKTGPDVCCRRSLKWSSCLFAP